LTRWLRNTRTAPIARKLTRMNMLASGTALLLAFVVLMVYDFVTFRSAMLATRSIQAQIVGANTVSALTFDDPATAERTLAALKAAPQIEGAGLYRPDGTPFASYRRDPDVAPLVLPPVPADAGESSLFSGFRLHLIRKVMLDGKPIGIVYIRSNVDEIVARLRRDAVLLGSVLLVSMTGAFLVSYFARRSISDPIAALAELANRVSTERDYSLRSTSTGQGEVGVLIASFNEMVEHIEQRDRDLRESHELLEQRVQQRTTELRTANKELEAFCYSVSHDLRSPLRAIDGFSQAILEDSAGALDAESQGHLARIRAATQRMGTLIDDLLNLSRISRAELHTEVVDMSALARTVIADLAALQPARQVDVTIEDGMSAVGDPRLLRQVLENLLGNAWKFTSRQPAARIEMTAATSDSGTTYTVKDNGAGFDPAHAGRLFGAFQRMHAMTDFPGTGVGLAIVERIVHRHGGEIKADAEVGRGATFFFTLGAPPPEADASDADA
jgi:signal transduction histidine kinase